MCFLGPESLLGLDFFFPFAHPENKKERKKWDGKLVVSRKDFAPKSCIRGGWRHGSV